MSSIVLKIPTKSQSFRAALTDATLRDRVQEWVAAAVRAKAAEWAPLAPGRYQALTVDLVDARALLDWQRFGAYNPHWVITDGF